MYVLLYIYSLLIGVSTFYIFKMDLFTLLLFVVITELFVFLLFRKFSFTVRPFERINFNLAMFVGYFYSMLMYGTVDFNMPPTI
jgi:hypothetical protein